MKTLATGLEVAEVPLGDVTLLGLQWLNDEKDIELRLKLHSSHEDFPQMIKLVAEFATHVDIKIDFGDKHMGAPLSWGFDLEMDSKGIYKALLDFGGSPDGAISFECNEIKITT